MLVALFNNNVRGMTMPHENEFKIPTPDGKMIDAILRGDPSLPLVLLVHGFGGQMSDVLQYMAARIFEQNGFSSLRFNFFGASSRARKGVDCSLASNGRDINTVLSFLKTELGAKKIFVAAHSYGFPSLLCADLSGISAIASWDGSLVPELVLKTMTPIAEPEGYLLNFAYSTLMGKTQIEEARKIRHEDLFKKGFAVPIIFAVSQKGHCFFTDEAQTMYALAKEPKKIIYFPEARHAYAEEGAEEALFCETILWFNLFL